MKNLARQALVAFVAAMAVISASAQGTIPNFFCFKPPTVLSNRSLIVVGQDLQGTAFAKLRPDGSLDTGFGIRGVVTFARSQGIGTRVVQLDGRKLLVVGPRLMRMNADGSLDTTYGVNGFSVPIMPFTVDPLIHSYAQQPDRSIVIAARGPAMNGLMEMVFTRFRADGQRDESFGTLGFQAVPSARWDDDVYAWSVQRNGAVDVGIAKPNASLNGVEATLRRLSPYQYVMSEFVPGARLVPEHGIANWMSSSAKVDPFGGLLIASSRPGSLSSEVILTRFGPDGLRDQGFGIDGQLIVAAGPVEPGANWTIGQPRGLLAESGGGWTVVVSQTTEFGVGIVRRSTNSRVLLRFNSAGGLAGPRATIEFPASQHAFTHLDDGSLLAVFTQGGNCNVAKIAMPAARAEGTLVEFYHPALDHYFITLDGFEPGVLDDNVATMGWLRTGQTFGAWGAVSLPGAARVCRFYGDVAAGPNSHFYIPEGAGCEGLRRLEADAPLGTPAWRLEGLTFATREAFGGTCASNLTPVVRYYNRGFERGVDSNHRYVVDAAVGAEMVAKGWVREGIAFCMPPASNRALEGVAD